MSQVYERGTVVDPVDWLIALSYFITMLAERDIYGFTGPDIWGGYKVVRADNSTTVLDYPLMPDLKVTWASESDFETPDTSGPEFQTEHIELNTWRYWGATFIWDISIGQSRKARVVAFNNPMVALTPKSQLDHPVFSRCDEWDNEAR